MTDQNLAEAPRGETAPPTAAAEPSVALPSPLPASYPGEPKELVAYRRKSGDEKVFVKLRRQFRDSEDWRALATLLVIHAAHMQAHGDPRGKASELCIQAYELWLERVRDRPAAAHALARAVMLKPDNARAYDRLRKLYEGLGARKELITLLRFRLSATRDNREAAELHLELADQLEQQFLAIGEAVGHYERALTLDPTFLSASERLADLYLASGAFSRASAVMNAELSRRDPTTDIPRIAELHRRLAQIESEQLGNVAGAARHLQAALKVVPDSITALRAFGVLYLSSGKASDGGAAKAADIFYKAAELARRRQDNPRALKLLRRALTLAPDHQQASAALENTLIDAQDWLALDDLYREWLLYFSGADAVPLMLRRADLLDTRLHRREAARQLYEEASRYQDPDAESWRHLEKIYEEASDYHALASLLEAQIERMPEDISTDTLLRTAAIYRDELGMDERAAVFYYKVLEREPFNRTAFEGYKEHWRRKHNWAHLRDLILYQIEQATAFEEGEPSPLDDPAFADEYAELADICERRLGDVDGALDAWHRLHAVYPRDSRPGKNIARIEKRARMWDNMVRVQEAELERTVDPRKRLDILKRLTQVYRDRQVNPTRAIELYNEILELSQGDVQATRALTALYDRAGDYPRVVEMLRDQYERSRSNTERTALLRRMAELWHHELAAPEEAMWACEAILEVSSGDKEAMYRLQQILEEQGQYDELLAALERELDKATGKEQRIKILRRMARVAERDLGDEDRAATIWSELLDLLPNNLEVIDRMIAMYEAAARYEELGTLVRKAASAPQTPVVRQVDYLLRLAQLAESSLDDAELARTAFEQVLKSRPDHRGALEALVRIYRDTESWQPLVVALGKLQSLAETDDDAFRIAWERSEILAEQIGDADSAIEVLEDASKDIALGNPEVARTLLEHYESSQRWRDVIKQAELLLLAAEAPDERRRLYETIANTWLRELDDKPAALAAYARFMGEFADDLDGLQTMAELQTEVGDHAGAIGSLQRRFELATDVELKVSTLREMADISETKLHDPLRAIRYVRTAVGLDQSNLETLDEGRRLAKDHQLWRELLGLLEERFEAMAQYGEVATQIEVGFEAAEVAETHYGDSDQAFDWAHKAYFVAVDEERDEQSQGYSLLQRLAADHDKWPAMLEVIDTEIERQTERGRVASGSFDVVARLLEASDIALERLDDPRRAVGLLQRAHRHRPSDEAIAKRLEDTATAHKMWQPIIELYGGRLERAVTDVGRYDASAAIARIYEEELDDPEKAFEWLEQSWSDLRGNDDGLARDAFDRLLGLAERHSLWPQMAQHHLNRAKEAFEGPDGGSPGLISLREAARVFDERMADPLGALRVLASGLRHDAGGQVLLPDIRELADKVDELRNGELPPLGSLLLLKVLQKLVSKVGEREDKLRLLEERAQVREEKLSDPRGAMAEWMRILRIEAELDQALVELERLADEHDLWHVFLLLPAWQLENAKADVVRQGRLLKRIAQHYEGPLERPEYALRARLAAWRRDPALPPREGDLDDTHAAMWRLAEQTGRYTTPPVPKDPLLLPMLPAPEIRDLELWRRAGLDVTELLSTIPSPKKPKIDVSSPAAIPKRITEELSISSVVDEASAEVSAVKKQAEIEAAASGAAAGVAKGEVKEEAPTNVQWKGPGSGVPERVPRLGEPAPRLEDASGEIMMLDLDELEVEVLEEVDPADEIDATIAGSHVAPPTEDPIDEGTRVGLSQAKRPPPPPRAPDAGLPALPKLTGPILPPRPRVASAWEEIALAYAEMPAPDKPAKAQVALVLARLWEEGAGSLERAFSSHEQALIWVPEDPIALQSMESLAERHNVVDRLLTAYEKLLAEAALPDHVVAMNLRIARLHESRDEFPQAEARYRAVLSVVPNHLEALSALAAIYESEERHEDYVQARIDMLEAERHDLSDDDRVQRSLEISDLLHERLARTEESVDRLELLVREFHDRREVHESLIEMLCHARQWQRAIDAMRTAWDNLEDVEFRFEHLAQVAMIYEERLNLPDRAIQAWAELAEAQGDAALPEELLDHALAKLQDLYLQTARYEPLLPIIEQRLGRLSAEDHDGRISLLVAKARVLQEGLGDEEGAMETLEELVAEAPDNDEVALGLSRLYRKTGRFDEGVTLLRDRLSALPDEDTQRRTEMSLALAEVLSVDGHDPKGALEVITEALEHDAESLPLRERRADLARDLHDLPLLAESLADLPGSAPLLEAADLLRTKLDDGPRALRMYSRVLAEAKQNPEDPAAARYLSQALEGLVRLRVADGDIDGAMGFMDRQLSEITGPSIRAQLLTEMGRITYESTGDVEAARERFDEALAEEPEFARAKLGLARILVEAGQLPRAEQMLEPTIEAMNMTGDQPGLVEGLLLVAMVFERTGRSGEAYRRLNAALKHDPDNLEIRAALVTNRYDAQRFRDVLTAADHLEQRLAEGFERDDRQTRLVSNIFVLAAQAELELKRHDNALERYRRAAEIDISNAAALEPLIGMCQERGALLEAALCAAALAKQTDDASERGQRLLEAGMLFHDAASALADGAEPVGDETEADMRKAAFEHMRLGLEFVEGEEVPILDRGQLEIAFRASADQDATTALRVLDRLLLHEDLSAQFRHDLLLEGARIAVEDDDRLEDAERYAAAARDLIPDSSSAVLMQARVLESADRVDEIERLVEDFFAKLSSRATGDGEDVATRVTLLLRLAEIQRARPEKAIASLEMASKLDPLALAPSDRRTLAELYEAAGRDGPEVLANHRQLLEIEPLHQPSLAALANHYASVGDLDHAWALYHVLALADPDYEAAKWFIEGHELHAEGHEPLDPQTVTAPAPADAGITEALIALWDGGGSILSEHLQKIEVPPDARISPLGDSALSLAWGEVLKRLGQTKVALVASDEVPADPDAAPDGAGSTAFFEVRCQQPPVILAHRPALEVQDAGEIRFALARAVSYTRPEAVFATGLRRATLATLLSAVMQAFHPRHSRRKHHHGKAGDKSSDYVQTLATELARKLPMRVARHVTSTFKDLAEVHFDSRVWRSWLRQSGNRIGLSIAGDIGAAIAVIAGEPLSGDRLRDKLDEDDDLRDLISFATGERFVRARRALGFSVRPAVAEG